jgi:hypothetical protein
MKINLNPQFSDLEIDIPEVLESDTQEKLQRTESWREERKGCWTGSQVKQLMSCNSKGARLPWNSIEKIYMFSEGAIKYIYANAMERKTGKYLEKGSNTQMKYGTAVEPLIAEIVRKEKEKEGLFFESVGFKKFKGLENAGASSDGVMKDSNDKILSSVEMKACCSWDSHFDRTFDLMDDKSIDFWQSQTQMLAWDVTETLYVVAEPPKDIMKYIKTEDIKELQEEFENECQISFQKVESSPIHQSAIMKRIEIAEAVIDKWNKVGGNLKHLFFEVLDEFKNKENMDEDQLKLPIEGLEEIKVEFEIVKPEIKEILTEGNFDDLPF